MSVNDRKTLTNITFMWMNIHTYIHTHTHTRVYIFHIYVYTYIHIHIYEKIYTHYIYTHKHIYSHMYIHIHTVRTEQLYVSETQFDTSLTSLDYSKIISIKQLKRTNINEKQEKRKHVACWRNLTQLKLSLLQLHWDTAALSVHLTGQRGRQAERRKHPGWAQHQHLISEELVSL